MPQHLTVKWVRAFSPDTEREYYAVLIENVNPLFVLRYVNIGPGCVVCVTRAPDQRRVLCDIAISRLGEAGSLMTLPDSKDLL